MGDGANILDVVVDLSLLVAGRSAAGLAGIDALEDAKAAKVLEADLQLAQAGRSADEGGVDAGMVLLLLLAHPRQLPLRAHARVAGRLDGFLLDASLDSISHGCVFFLLLSLSNDSAIGMNNSYNSRQVGMYVWGQEHPTTRKMRQMVVEWLAGLIFSQSLSVPPPRGRPSVHPSMTMMWAHAHSLNFKQSITCAS